MKNMCDHDDCRIGYLLRTASPQLIERYNKVHSLSIADIEEVYRRSEELCNFSNIFRKYRSSILIVLTALIFIIIFVCMMTKSNLVSGLSILMAVIFSLIFWFHLSSKESIEAINIKKRYSSVLEKFRDSVEGLFPYGCDAMNAEGAYRQLIICAVQILDAEKKFDTIRRHEGRMLDQILLIGRHLEKSYAVLGGTLDCNRDFGLEYDRRHLFAEARAIVLDQEKRSPTLSSGGPK